VVYTEKFTKHPLRHIVWLAGWVIISGAVLTVNVKLFGHYRI